MSRLLGYGLPESVNLLSSVRFIGLRVNKCRINPFSPKKEEEIKGKKGKTQGSQIAEKCPSIQKSIIFGFLRLDDCSLIAS